jgi:hypothetical protein
MWKKHIEGRREYHRLSTTIREINNRGTSGSMRHASLEATSQRNTIQRNICLIWTSHNYVWDNGSGLCDFWAGKVTWLWESINKKLINQRFRIIFSRKMLTNAPAHWLRKPNVVMLPWNLCIQDHQNIKSDIFNLKLSLLTFLTSVPRALVNMTLFPIGKFSCPQDKRKNENISKITCNWHHLQACEAELHHQH